MDKIIIHGGKKLRGTVRISGSKNASLPILIASILTDETCAITNVPDLADIDTTVGFVSYIGKNISRRGDKVTIEKNGRLRSSAPYDLVRKMRASVLVMGALLARLGHVKVSLPGGCAIGARPIDIHLDGFRQLGCEIILESGYVEVKTNGLRGAKIHLKFPSVGATENLLLASVLAGGITVIENAAREPEISDLEVVLNKMGAKVKGAGTSRITIEGVKKLKGFQHSVIPDRIEAATYLIAGAITKGDICLTGIEPKHVKIIIEKLIRSGISIRSDKDTVRCKWIKGLTPVNIKTGVYPGFPTDVQAQWMALMSLVKGKSVIEETIFENRFMHVSELQRLGANITIEDNKVRITGVNELSGAPIMVSDLRAGAALVLAGLVAKGKTEVLRIYHLDRGYEHLEKKLNRLGADITRVHC